MTTEKPPKEFVVYVVKGDHPSATAVFTTSDNAHEFVRVWIGDFPEEHARVKRWEVKEYD